jgi:hypothetical protein
MKNYSSGYWEFYMRIKKPTRGFFIGIGVVVLSFLMFYLGTTTAPIKTEVNTIISEPVTLYKEGYDQPPKYNLYPCPCSLSVGDEVDVNGCGWKYLGKDKYGEYWVGRKYEEGDCDGIKGSDILDVEDADTKFLIKFLKKGYNSFHRYTEFKTD